MSAAADYADAVLGDRPGHVAVAFGYGPYWSDDGKYRHRQWTETRFAWPGARDMMLTEVARVRDMGDADVFVCPAVRFTDDRRKGSALPPTVCWGDLDGDPADPELWERLAPYVVASGRRGHRHAYLLLTRPVDLGTHARLNQALARRLGADHKWSDETLLRLPGTHNHKTDPATPVTIESVGGGAWDPDELAVLLGADDPTTDGAHSSPSGAKPESVDTLPDRLRRRLAEPPPEDRSAAFHGLVGACHDAGLTQGQTVTVMGTWAPGVEKYGDRLPGEVARCWDKVGGRDGQRVDDDRDGDPDQYFDRRTGLKAATLAADIIEMGPLALGVDDILWSYAGGVWSPDKDAARARAARLLGERYRRSHGANAEDVVRSRVSIIRCDPVSESVNFRNGLYQWQADRLDPHTPDVLSTVQMSVDYNPEAECREFDKFLDEVLPADMIDLAWELIGYLMYSGNPLHRAVMAVGTGRNGKGCFLRVVEALLGRGNVTSVSLHDLVNTRFSTASLFGRIANIAGDIDGGYLESTATFKAVTGQDQISAEYKGRDRFDFTPWAVPVFSANKIPASSDVTTGYLSRWLVVPFPNDFTGREDRHLDARLQTTAELEGVAAKAMPALRRLMDRGDFDLPESGVKAMDEFTRRVDQVRTWVDECAGVKAESPFKPRAELYQKYRAWAERNGYKAVKAGEFYDRLSAVPGVAATRRHGGERGFTGIKVPLDPGTRDDTHHEQR